MRPNVIKRLLLLWLLLFGAVASMALMLPAAAAADPIVDVIPSSHDFGEVEVGSTASAPLLVTNFDGHNLIIYDIGFSAGSSADFVLVGVPVLPYIVVPMGWLELEVTYAPSAEGYAAAGLEIASNDAARPVLTVDLNGTGVAATPPPVDDLLVFFDGSVANGTLVGSGSGARPRAGSGPCAT